MNLGLVGTVISHYRIVEPLGSGGMGVVYKAEDLRLARPVAIKFLPDHTPDDAATLERFRREARAASALNHPNICTVYDIGDHDGRPFIVMEFLDGEVLQRRIEGRALPPAQVLELGIQVADALDAAHAKGIIHRDIKPANVFVTHHGHAKILDFGLAKLAEGRVPREGTDATSAPTVDVYATAAGLTMGTIAYMSPEQARGEKVDTRTDLFSFGATLYEMATGARAFPGGAPAVVFAALLGRSPEPPERLNADVPPELARIIAKALERDQQLRYQTAADLRADLVRLQRRSQSGGTAVAERPAVSLAVLPSRILARAPGRRRGASV